MSIRKRGSSYIVEIWDKERGKDRHVKPSEFGLETPKTMREAKKLEALALAARVRGDETCGEFARRWLRDFPRSPQTMKHNSERIKTFIVEFDRVPLQAFSRRQAEEWASANGWRVPAVRAMFTDAVNSGHVDRNPFRGLGPETDGRRHKRPPSIDEVMALADCAERHYGGEFGQQMNAMVVFMFYSMMRPGEVFAARWRHLNGDRFYVAEQFNSDLCQITEPKHDSRGEVIIAPPALDLIRALPRRIDDDLMFRTRRGKMFRQESFWRTWEPLRAMVGDPSLTPYDLRHAGASHMLNVLHVEPWIIGRQLRHDPKDGGKLVVALYGHPDDDVTLDRIRQAFTPEASNRNLSGTPDRTPDASTAIRF